MAKVKFEANIAGYNALRKSPEMQAILRDIGTRKAAEAGTGYASDVHVFGSRAVAHIYPESYEAEQDNLENNTLLRVIS